MNQFNSPAASSSTDAGLRNFMLGTYRYLAMAMFVSMVVAVIVGNFVILNVPFQPDSGPSAIGVMLFSPIFMLGMVGALFVFSGMFSKKIYTLSVTGALAFLFGFAALMGVFLSAVAAFVDPLISGKIFFMATAAFAGVSLVGYMTKKDLGVMAKFAFMVFFGVFAIFALGMFVPSMRPSGNLDLLLNIVGLLAVCVMAAWKTQDMKRMYYQTQGNEVMSQKVSILAASFLLVSFVNIFQFLLSIFGSE